MGADDEVAGSRLGTTAAEWVSARWIAVEGRRIRYREAGGGVPVVLVHGLGASADYWVRNAAVIAAAGCRVLAPDLPGFGATAGPRLGLDVPAQAEAIRKWTRALDLAPAVYIGHSLSCQAMLELAAEHPELVRGLVLAAPTGHGASYRRLTGQALGLVRDLTRESIKLAALVAYAYARAGPLRVLRTWKMGATHDPLPLLPRVRAPALVVRGERDPVVSHSFAESIAAGLPQGRLLSIPGAAHGVTFDPTGAFNSGVIQFLTEVLGLDPQL